MGIKITLRTNSDKSYFRENLLNLVKVPDAKELILCSGYISEGKKYSVADDGLMNSIKSLKSGIKVITIAGKFSYDWGNQYKNFVYKLKKAQIKVKPFQVKQKNWHAKIALVKGEKKVLAGIVGSSNLTRPAYGEKDKVYKKFNYEADVLIWRNDSSCNKWYQENYPEEIEEGFAIKTILDPKMKQPDEGDRLQELYDMVMALTTEIEELGA